MKNITAWFDEYTEGFIKHEKTAGCPLRLRIEHSRTVAKEIVDIASKNGFSKHEQFLAECVGLLHDIGRFEQYKEYRTFNDRLSANHALIGLKVLSCSTALNELEPGDRKIVLKAVELHNAKQIPDNLSLEEKTFARLIRDADKIDIFRIVIDYYGTMHTGRNEAIELDLPDTPGFTEGIINDLLAGELADYSMLQTLNDFKLVQMSWVHDLNFPRSFEIFAERKYLDKLYSFLPKNERVSRIYEIAQAKVKSGALAKSST